MNGSNPAQPSGHEPSKDELLEVEPHQFDTDSLKFTGPRGDKRRHLDRATLLERLHALPPAPRDRGTVELLVARGPNSERHLPHEALLTVEGGMPGDRWHGDDRYGPEYQLATTQVDYARVIANGQSLDLHGDNLYLNLDLSEGNLPVGAALQLGDAVLSVTEQAHNGCKKWAQRFGLAPLKLNLAPEFRARHLRGIYLQVVQSGLVRVGDAVVVLQR